MRICVNARDLADNQRTEIEQYFHENFSFGGKNPTLIWKNDDSEFILLGYVHGAPSESEVQPPKSHDLSSTMFRVHENELMRIAGRSIYDTITLPSDG